MTDSGQQERDVDPTEPADGEVVEGKRISVSPVTGAVYLVTRWVEAGDGGKMRALDKRELDEHEIEALSDDARAFIEEKQEEGLGYDEDELVTDGGQPEAELHHCQECDDDVPATWDGGVLTCDECGWVIYK